MHRHGSRREQDHQRRRGEALTGATTEHFGGITRGPNATAGLGELSVDALGDLYHKRTNLGARTLKSLPDRCKDAPEKLRSLPKGAANVGASAAT